MASRPPLHDEIMPYKSLFLFECVWLLFSFGLIFLLFKGTFSFKEALKYNILILRSFYFFIVIHEFIDRISWHILNCPISCERIMMRRIPTFKIRMSQRDGDAKKLLVIVTKAGVFVWPGV